MFSKMHLKPATHTNVQPHNEQDMGFSMLSQSGERRFFFCFPVSNYVDIYSSQKIIFHISQKLENLHRVCLSSNVKPHAMTI